MSGEGKSTRMPVAPNIRDMPTLLAHAYAIEVEAAERYRDLADQMEVFHNAEVSALFKMLARLEDVHAREIMARADGVELPDISAWDYSWQGLESPESVEHTEVHYLMTPYHALKAALAAEQRAYNFFFDITRTARDAKTAEFAQSLAEDEAKHVRQIKQLLERQTDPGEDWRDDPDPPTLQG